MSGVAPQFPVSAGRRWWGPGDAGALECVKEPGSASGEQSQRQLGRYRWCVVLDSPAVARPPLPLSRLDERTWRLDCRGLLCPVPVIKTGRAVREVPIGGTLEVLADDPGAELDLRDWCSANRHELLHQRVDGEVWTTHIRRAR